MHKSKMAQQRVVLITGAGSGIGFASALEYAKAGFKVVATMRLNYVSSPSR